MDHPTVDTDATSSELAREMDALLLAFLADRDVACPACQYNLRGLTRPCCPECGRELRLTVGLTEPVLRAWIALAVGVFASAGIGGLFWMLVLFHGPPGSMPLSAWVAFVYFMASPILIWPTLAKRRRFLRLASDRQWLIAATALVMMLLLAIIFVARVR